MPFTELYSAVISQKDSYVKKVKVLLCTGGNERTYWVDIRCHYNFEDEWKPTKFGVCITVDELKKLLPDMMALKDCDEDNQWRRVWFKKSDKKFLYDLNLRKFDGKETSISLTHKDIKKINFIKDRIYNCINH
jgi:hypothetical protein